MSYVSNIWFKLHLYLTKHIYQIYGTAFPDNGPMGETHYYLVWKQCECGIKTVKSEGYK